MKTFKSFLSESKTLPHWPKTKEELQAILDEVSVDEETGEVYINPSKTRINSDLSVSIEGDVTWRPLSKFDGYFPFKFKEVHGTFRIDAPNSLTEYPSMSMKTLIGAPDKCEKIKTGFSYVRGSALSDSIKVLEGLPKFVESEAEIFLPDSVESISSSLEIGAGGSINIHGDGLKDFSFLPKSACRRLWLKCQNFTENDFKYLPNEVKDLSINSKALKSLKGLSNHLKKADEISFESALKSHVLSVFQIQGLQYVQSSFDNDGWVDIVNEFLPGGDVFECQEALIEAGFEEHAQI